MTQLTDLESLAGRTIERAAYADDELVLVFTDGAFVAIEKKYHYDDAEGEVRVSRDEPRALSLYEGGLISEQEYKERSEALSRRMSEEAKEARRKQFEILKQEFDPGPPTPMQPVKVSYPGFPRTDIQQ